MIVAFIMVVNVRVTVIRTYAATVAPFGGLKITTETNSNFFQAVLSATRAYIFHILYYQIIDSCSYRARKFITHNLCVIVQQKTIH